MDKKTQQAHDDVRTVQRLQDTLGLEVSVTAQTYSKFVGEAYRGLQQGFSIYHDDNGVYLMRLFLKGRLPPLLDKSFSEIREQYFSDILHPTENELVMFKLMHGFDWVLKEDGTSNLEETFKQLEELYPHDN